MSDLPKGWITIRTGDVGDWRGGGTPSKANNSFWTDGTIPWVSPKDMKRPHIAEAIDNITDEAIAGSATQLIPEGSVLIVTRSGILQHSLPVAANTVPVAINQDLKALTPHNGIETEFVMRQLQADAQEILKTCAKAGTTVDSLDFERFKDHEFRLPPLPEQRRIVAKVDGLTARTARARKELDRIPTLIARYKQCLLATIFERLGKDGHAAHLGGISCFVTSGSRGWAQYYAETGDMFVRVGNVKRTEINLDLSDVQRVTPPPNAEGLRTKLQRNDLLVTITADLGRVGVYESDDVAYVNQHVALVRLWEPDQARYVAWYLASEEGQTSLHRNTRGATKAGLGLDDIREVEIPLPPIEEQAEIVRRIESAFGWLDRMAADHTAAARLLPKLDAAILAKAFRGELVPQNPNDEPASVLLERVRAERDVEHGKPKIGRGRPRLHRLEAVGITSGQPYIGKPTVHILPATKKASIMSKSRKDADVMGKPYLTKLVRDMGGKVTPNELYAAANLSMVDFYQQLSLEHDRGWLEDDNTMVKAA